MTADELEGLADPARWTAFSEQERAALVYAEAVTTGNTVSEQVFGNLRKHFDDDAIVELTAGITFEICAAKFNRALEIEGQGICAVRPAAK